MFECETACVCLCQQMLLTAPQCDGWPATRWRTLPRQQCQCGRPQCHTRFSSRLLHPFFPPHPSYSSSCRLFSSSLPPFLVYALSTLMAPPTDHLQQARANNGFKAICGMFQPGSFYISELTLRLSASSSFPAPRTFSCPQMFLPALISSSPLLPSLPRFSSCFFLLSSPLFISPLHGTVAL